MKCTYTSMFTPLLVLFGILMLQGCASESLTEKEFGSSVRNMIAHQRHHPSEEATGLSGEKSRYIFDEYRTDVAKPKAVEQKIINIKLD